MVENLSPCLGAQGNPANRLDKGCQTRFRGLPARSQGRLSRRADRGGRGRQADDRQATGGPGSRGHGIGVTARGDAYRVVYALQLAAEIWVIHAFQKKSKAGIKTPKAEIELVIERLKRLKEVL